MVILDESESILQQITSGLSPYEHTNFEVFQRLVRLARQVVLIDAFLSAKSVCVMRAICPLRAKKLVLNEFAVPKTYKIYPGSAYEYAWLEDLKTAINSGLNVVVPCNVASVAKSL